MPVDGACGVGDELFLYWFCTSVRSAAGNGVTGPVICQIVARAGFGLVVRFDPFDGQGNLVISQLLEDAVKDCDESRVLEQ